MRHRALLALLLPLALATSCTSRSNAPTVSGTVETDEVHVASRTGGRVAALHAREGESLTSGQLIAELSAPELGAQRDQVAAQLAEWQAGPRPQEIAAAASEAEALASELTMARTDARRATELFNTKVSTAAELDRAEARVRTLERQLDAARQRHELLQVGTRPERLAMARAQLAELDARLAELRVTAPTNCVLETLPVKVGDVLSPGREVATLLLASLWVRVYVPQPWLGHLHLGDAVKLHADAFPGREFAGTVEQISRQAEFTPRNVQTPDDRIRQVFGVKVRLDAKGDLRAGMSVDVTFAQVPVGAPPNRNQ
jgi:HlyD family secretion protein